jgi:hypothetical protein
MPPISKLNKDFLKNVLAGRKKLIPMNQVRPINVPKYDELSVIRLYKDAMAQASLAVFFPDIASEKHLPDREYFFNIINTIEPVYLDQLIRHAQTTRLTGKDAQPQDQMIEVDDFWKKELQASPFYSSNFQRLILFREPREIPDAA